MAARLATNGTMVVFPRPDTARGEAVRVELDVPAQIDVFEELFIEGIYDLNAVGFAPELVVDCGAFCGYFSAMAAGFFPAARLCCFEANPDNLPALRAQVEQLRVRVEINEAAVYIRDGFVTFSGTGMGGSISRWADSTDPFQVPCVDFAKWLSARSPASLVWKLDVEGAELEVLPATLDFLPRPTICFLETHLDDPTCERLLAPYRGAGFSVSEIRRRPSGVGDYSYIEWRLTREN